MMEAMTAEDGGARLPAAAYRDVVAATPVALRSVMMTAVGKKAPVTVRDFRCDIPQGDAARMGQIRGLLRALAYDAEDRAHGASPAVVLTRLEYVAQGPAVSELSTAILARLEDSPDGSGRLPRWSNVGNPPPVVLLADGSTLLLDDKSDLLLGVDPAFPRRDHEVTLPPGSTLLLHTIDVGIDDLRAALSDMAGAPLGLLCDSVLETLDPHTGEDDIALIAVRV